MDVSRKGATIFLSWRIQSLHEKSSISLPNSQLNAFQEKQSWGLSLRYLQIGGNTQIMERNCPVRKKLKKRTDVLDFAVWRELSSPAGKRTQILQVCEKAEATQCNHDNQICGHPIYWSLRLYA